MVSPAGASQRRATLMAYRFRCAEEAKPAYRSRTSTVSPSLSSYSLPTCWPGNRAAGPVLGGPLDQARDLHELDEHAAEARRRGDGPRRGERIVAGADLDRGESLQERRLARVRRPDEGDLRRPLAPHGDRVAMHDP